MRPKIAHLVGLVLVLWTVDAAAVEPAPEIDAGVERTRAALATYDLEAWERVEQLVALDEQQWAALESLLQLDAAALEALAAELASSPTAGDAGDTNLPDLWDVLSRIASVKGIVETIRGRLPDRPDVKATLDRIDLDRLKDALDTVKVEIAGIVDTARELREGYQDWADAGCGSRGLCQFRQEVRGLFADVQDTWEVAQRLACLDDPATEIRPLAVLDQGEIIDTVLLEKAPPVVLFALQRVLDLLPDWQNMVGDIHDAIPVELTEFCEAAGEAELAEPAGAASYRAAIERRREHRGATRLDRATEPGLEAATSSLCLPETFAGSARCCRLRRPAVGGGIQTARVVARHASFAFELVEALTSDDKQVTAGAVAVGGAAAGTNAKNPGNAIPKVGKVIADRVDKFLERHENARKQCLDTDTQLERDLFTCTTLAEYTYSVGDGGRFEEVADLVDRRIAEVCGDTECQGARADVESARLTYHFPTLCTAYEKLTRRE